MSHAPRFICPICQSSLSTQERSFVCENKHSFDIAKEGYVNLLPVQFKKSLQPGDDKNMVQARRAFLQTGAYEFLQQALIKEIQALSPDSIVDLGCGEGYYTNALSEQTVGQVYGIDISKSAVKYAAKRSQDVHYAVATNAHLPFSDHSIAAIVNVFAPLIGSECQRILKEDGYILSVAPGPNHLLELKQRIYDTPEQHSKPLPPDGFILNDSKQLTQLITISSPQQFEDLLTMTPFGWKITPENKANALNDLPMQIQLDFILSQFRIEV